MAIEKVPLNLASRLLNHGPTVMVSATHENVSNVMTAAWACNLDFDPPKLTVVLGNTSKTRELLLKSTNFVVQIPTVAQIDCVFKAGHTSLANDPQKLKNCGITLMDMPDMKGPFVKGCAAWMACKLIPEEKNQSVYDLFMGEIIGAWAQSEVFQNGHWNFEKADPKWRSIHYVADGHYYATGEGHEYQK